MKHPLVKRKNKWYQSPIVSVILVLLIVWAAFAVVGAYRKDRDATMMRDQSARELDDLNAKKIELGNHIQNLSTERGIEAEIRNRYRVERPGENLVIVVDNGEPDKGHRSETDSFWTRLRAYIGW